jgi:hypothetical protein
MDSLTAVSMSAMTSQILARAGSTNGTMLKLAADSVATSLVAATTILRGDKFSWQLTIKK